ncbi:hypothetical protein BL250_07310 [Erwinia sp. OLTSP20]|uniref:fimbrial protein n=1 Tax=unclassified Erwinia TaxID=2622719 RepID=UPI000C19CCCF|nr:MULTISPECIES: fimbrial protein [unclassified Erwinia]PIJ50584.1 hypothetical protein BV501_08115 [Erwinia sp. OAMSP11]PIJ72902.1 hypothetical protein BK416_08390 [Erwinia sp. OLSSP12]PIJ82232.1 hypothetical protein BLD47_06850 [Erwinia sp. OLCASP19]PIJ84785.1 hypothetical protein BLD46_07245 [Erwinia sp. OLMTSP26]PIJ86750.1 hypothetical protein BLD49_07970 [Erwinia sp. OLMDSP33]
MEWTAPSGSVTVEDLDPEGNVTATLNFPLTLISQGVMIPDKEGSAVVGDIHGGSRVLGPLHSNTVRVSVNLTSGAPATLAVSESGKVESTSAKAFSFHLIQFAPVLTMNPELTPGFYVNGRIPIRSCTIYSDDRVIPAIGCRVTRTFAEADPFDLLPAAPSCTTQLGGSGLLSFGRVTGQDLIAGADASGRVSSLTQQLTLDTRCDSSTAATKTVIRVMGDAVTSQRDSTGTPVFGSSNPGLGYALSVSTNGGAPAALQPNTPVNIATPAANNSHAIAVTPVLLTDKAPPSGTAVSHVTLDIWPGVG